MTANITKNRRRQIIIPFGMRKEIADVLGVTSVTVWNALTYRTDSKKAQQIRALAEKKLQELNN
jgi:hypothetical protein